jgi:hypothetical protein
LIISEHHEFLGHYIKNAAQGTFGIAAFQRPFVWEKRDVEDFMLSIQKGFPVGTFLLWTPDAHAGVAPPSKGRIGPVEHGVETKTVILDGQNRLSALVWAARVGEAPAAPVYPYSKQEIDVFLSGETLVIDADEKRIHFVPSADAWGKNRMPLGDALSYGVMGFEGSRAVFKRLEERGVGDEHLNWMLDTVPHWFQGKRTVVTEIQDATTAEALEAFLVIAKAGQPISKDDYTRAVEWIGSFDEPAVPSL